MFVRLRLHPSHARSFLIFNVLLRIFFRRLSCLDRFLSEIKFFLIQIFFSPSCAEERRLPPVCHLCFLNRVCTEREGLSPSPLTALFSPTYSAVPLRRSAGDFDFAPRTFDAPVSFPRCLRNTFHTSRELALVTCPPQVFLLSLANDPFHDSLFPEPMVWETSSVVLFRTHPQADSSSRTAQAQRYTALCCASSQTVPGPLRPLANTLRRVAEFFLAHSGIIGAVSGFMWHGSLTGCHPLHIPSIVVFFRHSYISTILPN